MEKFEMLPTLQGYLQRTGIIACMGIIWMCAWQGIIFADVFPGEVWRTASPESQGVDPIALDQALSYFKAHSGGVGVDEMVIIKNGYVVWKGPAANSFHSIHSGTKTFVTTILGVLIMDGTIASMGDRVVNYDPQFSKKYPDYVAITFKHLASFTSGYRAVESLPPDSFAPFGDPCVFLEPGAPLAKPGLEWEYNDPAIHQLANILTKISGESLEHLFNKRIADKIGIKKWKWKNCGYKDNGASQQVVRRFLNASGTMGGGVFITPLDVARYGLLYLNRGAWDGKQLLPSSWVDEATSNQVPLDLDVRGLYDCRGRFGYMWWTNGVTVNGKRPWPAAPLKTYTFLGSWRDYCFIVPEWNMVIVRMSPPDQSRMPKDSDAVWNGFFSRLAPGVSITTDQERRERL